MSYNLDPKKVKEEDTDAKFRDLFNQLVDTCKFQFKNFSLKRNISGQVVENLVVAGATSILIPHFLGVKPKHRLILNQVGNGVLTDLVSEWTDKYITLYNNGSVEVTFSILIVRE